MDLHSHYVCDECGGALGEDQHCLYWWEVCFRFCGERCKRIWHAKKIAEENRKSLIRTGLAT